LVVVRGRVVPQADAQVDQAKRLIGALA
jgi:hypothetical protein